MKWITIGIGVFTVAYFATILVILVALGIFLNKDRKS